MVKTLIRQAVGSDFPTLLRIDESSFPPGIAYDFSELSYFMQLEGAHTLVAELNGEIIGFILVEIVERKKCATLVTLDIRKQHQRMGYATELLAASEEVLRKNRVERFELQVDVDNDSAMQFYRKNGFEKVRQLPNYYSNGHDAYLMTKSVV